MREFSTRQKGGVTMKILVNNEREKELFEKFTEFLSDYAESEEMRELMGNADYLFDAHEIDFLQTGFWQSTIVVDEKVWDIMVPADNLTGTCKYCDGQWQGIEDVSEVNIHDYEQFLNPEKENSYHAECLRDNQCVNCGSDEDTELVGDEGLLCEDCRKQKL